MPWNRTLIALVICGMVTLAWALPGVLDRVHRRHGAIYSYVQREVLSSRGNEVQVRASLRLGALSAEPMWKRYWEELPRVEPAHILTGAYDDRVAFWLNLRNTMVMRAMIQGIPPLTTEATYSSLGVIGNQTVDVAGITLTLDQVETRLLELGEPWVLYGLCRGTETSPPWPGSPFTGNGLKDRLMIQGREWLANPAVLRWDHPRKILYLSRELQLRQDWLLTLEPNLSREGTLGLYPKAEGLLLAALRPAMAAEDSQRLMTARYRIQWMPASDQLLLARP